jgi:predicted regulator of Ras-like GTPase activity (Roadblock/LC7/MglB family)
MERLLNDLLSTTPEIEAAAVVSYDGLPMASALPHDFDEDRLAAMSAALLSLGERATTGLGRGGLSQIYVEGEHGTVFLVSAEEAVLVAIASAGAKVGMLRYEVRHAASRLAAALRAAEPQELPREIVAQPAPVPVAVAEPVAEAVRVAEAVPVAEPVPAETPYASVMPYVPDAPLEPSGWQSYSSPGGDVSTEHPWS